MLEQKLFFTRNGEYTLWEKIQFISESKLDYIINNIITVNKELYISTSKQRFIYLACKSNTNYDENKKLRQYINQYFIEDLIEETDFNATIYKLNLSYIDIDKAFNMLNRLRDYNTTYDDNKYETSIFFRKDINVIDIRLSSIKINDYKDNSNEQVVNTEVRIYVDIGLMLMTDYNEYTHIKSVKELFKNNISEVLGSTVGRAIPCMLSDMTLRILLKKSKNYASNFKFSVDDFMNVKFNISESINDDPLEYNDLKEFYDNHKISMIKISMNDNREKCITIDGERAKLISRGKNMCTKDVDEFIYLLSDVIKYDYLNLDHIKEIKEKAKDKLIGPTTFKYAEVDYLYNTIVNKIKSHLKEFSDYDSVIIVRNAFLYCLVNGITIKNHENIRYDLDEKVLSKLSKLLDIDQVQINKLFNHIIGLCLNNKEIDLLEKLDNYINLKGEENVNRI